MAEMTKGEKRARKFTKLSLIFSTASFLGAVVAIAAIIKKWRPEENIIDAGDLMKPLIMAALAGCCVFGVAGFLLALEGLGKTRDKWQRYGWMGFWLGAASATVGVILAVVFFVLKYQ